MKVAFVHDYLNEFGGAERVLLALSEIWPKAPIYTAFYRKGSSAYKRFKGKKIITSWAQKVPFFAKGLFSPLRFLAPFIWNSFSPRGGSSSGRDLSQFDVVISSSSWYVTKGFGKNNKQETINRKLKPVEICYCHTPPRYLYGYPTASDMQKYWFVKVYALLVNHFMRVYDFEAAQRVDWFIANSKEVQSRIKKFYRRDSTVIYPPVDVSRFAGPVGGMGPAARFPRPTSSLRTNLEIKSNMSSDAVGARRGSPTRVTHPDSYFLVVSRLVGAKNVDIAVEVCRNLELPLKVVGTGREIQALMRLAGKSLIVNGSSGKDSDSIASPDTVRYLASLQNDKGEVLKTHPRGVPGRSDAHPAGEASIEFLGDVSDEELIELYQGCRTVIFPASQEDFGLVPVEAMAAGKPVIALAEGGVLESVIDATVAGKGKGTGVYFDPATTGSLTLAINNFVDLEKKGYFDPKFIKKHAEKFSKERFKREIKAFVADKVG